MNIIRKFSIGCFQFFPQTPLNFNFNKKLKTSIVLLIRWIAIDIITSVPNKRTVKAVNIFVTHHIRPNVASRIIKTHKQTIQRLITTDIKTMQYHKMRTRPSNVLTKVLESIFTNLSKPKSGGKLVVKNFSLELKVALQNPKTDMKNVLRIALRCIYEVRNAVIHHGLEIPILQGLNNMLDDVLREFWTVRLRELSSQKT